MRSHRYLPRGHPGVRLLGVERLKRQADEVAPVIVGRDRRPRGGRQKIRVRSMTKPGISGSPAIVAGFSTISGGRAGR